MHYRVHYLFDFDLKIRSGQVWQWNTDSFRINFQLSGFSFSTFYMLNGVVEHYFGRVITEFIMLKVLQKLMQKLGIQGRKKFNGENHSRKYSIFIFKRLTFWKNFKQNHSQLDSIISKELAKLRSISRKSIFVAISYWYQIKYVIHIPHFQ